MKTSPIDDAFFRAKALLLVEDPLTREVVSACWKLQAKAMDVTVRAVGGRDAVQSLVQAAREQQQRHVFGLVDRDFGAPRRDQSVWTTTRHEIENHLLDFTVMASLRNGVTPAQIEQDALRHATDLQAWMAVRDTLQALKRAEPAFPADRSPAAVPDLAAANAYVGGIAFATDVHTAVCRIWTVSHLQSQLTAHHTKRSQEIAGGTWVEHFSGKEIFRRVRAQFFGDSRITRITNDNDLGRKIAEHWRTSGGTPAVLDELRDYIIREAGL